MEKARKMQKMQTNVGNRIRGLATRSKNVRRKFEMGEKLRQNY
jgi:hypothetical protein